MFCFCYCSSEEPESKSEKCRSSKTRGSGRYPGLGWNEPQALRLYAWYTGLIYLTPLFGGWLADNVLGQRRAVIIGGLMMAAGQFTLASPLDLMGTSGAFTLNALGIAFPDAPTSFYVGLLLLILGNGLFKPNISTMVGNLYPEGSHLKDKEDYGKSHDVPYGQGVGEIGRVLAELKEQGFDGNISIEYEHNWENSLPEVKQCVDFVRNWKGTK